MVNMGHHLHKDWYRLDYGMQCKRGIHSLHHIQKELVVLVKVELVCEILENVFKMKKPLFSDIYWVNMQPPDFQWDPENKHIFPYDVSWGSGHLIHIGGVHMHQYSFQSGKSQSFCTQSLMCILVSLELKNMQIVIMHLNNCPYNQSCFTFNTFSICVNKSFWWTNTCNTPRWGKLIV